MAFTLNSSSRKRDKRPQELWTDICFLQMNFHVREQVKRQQSFYAVFWCFAWCKSSKLNKKPSMHKSRRAFLTVMTFFSRGYETRKASINNTQTDRKSTLKKLEFLTFVKLYKEETALCLSLRTQHKDCVIQSIQQGFSFGRSPSTVNSVFLLRI